MDKPDSIDFEDELELCRSQANLLLEKEGKTDQDWRSLYVLYKLLSQLCAFRNYKLEAKVSHYCPNTNYLECGNATVELGCSPNCYICSAQCFIEAYGSQFEGLLCRVCGQLIPPGSYARILGTQSS